MFKVLVIGGNSGIGKWIVDGFQADNVSRSTGYDICDPLKRVQICNLATDYDIIINNAYGDGYSQLEMLHLLVTRFKDTSKTIINIGSIKGDKPSLENLEKIKYSNLKHAMNDFIKKININKSFLRCRVVNIKLGLCDTEFNKNKQDIKLNKQDIINHIEYILNTGFNIYELKPTQGE